MNAPDEREAETQADGQTDGQAGDSQSHQPTEPAFDPDVTQASSPLPVPGPLPVSGSSPSSGSQPRSLIGRKLGDYQVLRKLGRGGMADVYTARQLSLGRDVALKVLKSEYARDADYVERFRREARAAAKLNHPNIVQVFDVGSVDSQHYIAQELVDGENLREVVGREGRLEVDAAIEVLAGVASALEVASEAGITHRDIKPENIMRSSRGIVKVADFGLARLGADAGVSQADLTQAGLTLGTPRYMSPEQVQGHVADVRSDLYSLGVTMYHLLAGRPPFEADDPLALAVLHLHETPAPLDRARGRNGSQPDLPEWLIAVVSRLMNKLPQDRFQSPSELLDAIRNEASESKVGGFGMVGTAAATIRLQRATDQVKRQRGRRWLGYAAAIILPITCGVAAFAAMQRQPQQSVSNILRPDEVTEAETIQEQFLIAMTRNDEAGWKSVIEFFPEPTSTNAAYHAKATLQLAAYQASGGQLRAADLTLRALLDDPKVDRLYLAIALARRCDVLKQLGDTKRLGEARERLAPLYQDLQNENPQAAEIFDRVIPAEERLELGTGVTSSITPRRSRPEAGSRPQVGPRPQLGFGAQRDPTAS